MVLFKDLSYSSDYIYGWGWDGLVVHVGVTQFYSSFGVKMNNNLYHSISGVDSNLNEET